MPSRIGRFIFWTSRILAALMAAFILMIFIGEALGEGLEPLLNLTLRETLMMVAFWAVFAGLILGWFRQRAGGWLVVAGMAVFYLLDFAFSGTFPRGPIFLLIALPGALNLLEAYSRSDLTHN